MKNIIFLFCFFCSCSFAYNVGDIKFQKKIYHCKKYFLYSGHTECIDINDKQYTFYGSHVIYNQKTYTENQWRNIYEK